MVSVPGDRLILVCGIAGAGKTILAKQVEAEGAVRMCPDEWIVALGSRIPATSRQEIFGSVARISALMPLTASPISMSWTRTAS